MVRNPPSTARNLGSLPDWGTEIPHAMEQLKHVPQTAEPTQEPQPESARCQKSPTWCSKDTACCSQEPKPPNKALKNKIGSQREFLGKGGTNELNYKTEVESTSVENSLIVNRGLGV